MIRRNALLFLLAFTLALGLATWGTHWKVKMTGTESLCAFRLAYCHRDSEADDFMREVDQVSGCCGPPNAVEAEADTVAVREGDSRKTLARCAAAEVDAALSNGRCDGRSV